MNLEKSLDIEVSSLSFRCKNFKFEREVKSSGMDLSLLWVTHRVSKLNKDESEGREVS